VGNVTTPFDAEPAIGAKPDLIVTLTDGSDDPDLYWSIDPKIVGVAREIAPILAINTSVQLDQVVARFAELATALGADLASEEIRTSKTAADQAALDFAAGVEAKPELNAIFISTTEEALYIANPKVASDLIYFRELGLDIPDLDVADTEYWEKLDWEQALKYPVDVVFYSTRVGLTADELKAHPVFSRHPAVIAGQLYPWNGEEPLSYQGITTTLTNTLASIEAAKPVEA
jgi:iron complex transport system substrate-binding protein